MSFNARIHTSPFLKIHNYVHNDNRYTRSLISSDLISFYFISCLMGRLMLNAAGRNVSYGHSKRVTSVRCCLSSFSLLIFSICDALFTLACMLRSMLRRTCSSVNTHVRYYTYVKSVFSTMYAVSHI